MVSVSRFYGTHVCDGMICVLQGTSQGDEIKDVMGRDVFDRILSGCPNEAEAARNRRQLDCPNGEVFMHLVVLNDKGKSPISADTSTCLAHASHIPRW